MEYDVHPVFNLKVPRRVEGIDPKVLDARSSWKDRAAYDAAAEKLRANGGWGHWPACSAKLGLR